MITLGIIHYDYWRPIFFFGGGVVGWGGGGYKTWQVRCVGCNIFLSIDTKINKSNWPISVTGKESNCNKFQLWDCRQEMPFVFKWHVTSALFFFLFSCCCLWHCNQHNRSKKAIKTFNDFQHVIDPKIIYIFSRIRC